MSAPNDGGPAFPQHGWTSNPEVLERMKDQGGMTLRDWFAGQASESDIIKHMAYDTFGNCQKSREEARFAFADAMLKARNDQ